MDSGRGGRGIHPRFLHESKSSSPVRAIKETGVPRQSSSASISNAQLAEIQYHDYVVFSTTTWADSTLTYGYFGRVQTTDNVGWLYESDTAQNRRANKRSVSVQFEHKLTSCWKSVITNLFLNPAPAASWELQYRSQQRIRWRGCSRHRRGGEFPCRDRW
jgi:hypothetical protein